MDQNIILFDLKIESTVEFAKNLPTQVDPLDSIQGKFMVRIVNINR